MTRIQDVKRQYLKNSRPSKRFGPNPKLSALIVNVIERCSFQLPLHIPAQMSPLPCSLRILWIREWAASRKRKAEHTLNNWAICSENTFKQESGDGEEELCRLRSPKVLPRAFSYFGPTFPEKDELMQPKQARTFFGWNIYYAPIPSIGRVDNWTGDGTTDFRAKLKFQRCSLLCDLW